MDGACPLIEAFVCLYVVKDETVLTFQFTIFQPAREKPASPPRMKIQNEKDAHSSMPPDKASTAWDVTSLPVSGSHLVPGKRSLPVPNKVGWPGLGQWGLACERGA